MDLATLFWYLQGVHRSYPPYRPDRCEACRLAPLPAPELEPLEDEMLLCDVCRARARAEALRPGEWFNLASIYSLDDPRLECYTIRGEATAPLSPVVDASACPLPDAEAVRRDLSLLLDWALVYHGAGRSARAQQFHLEALRAFRLDEVLAAVQQARRPGPRDPYSVLVRVVGEAFGREAAPWVAAQLASPNLSEAGLFVVPAIDAFAPERLASAVLPYFDRLEPADLLRRWDESLPQVAAAVPPRRGGSPR